MTITRYEMRNLLKRINSGDDSARIEILQHDEDAVDALTDEFYSGVNEATGVIILNLLTEIGGPDALLVLVDVANNARYPTWKAIAHQAVTANGWHDMLDT